jgi:CheY-like chemotaxis protein
MKKILVVDDERSIVAYLTAVLDDAGYDICSAMDGVAGLQVARKERPDLICLDIMMPKRGGISLYTEIRRDEELQHLPVVFISAYSQVRDLRDPVAFRKMIPDGAIPHPNLCLEKPIKVPVFLEEVARLIDEAEAVA